MVEALSFERFDIDSTTGKVKTAWGIFYMVAYLPQADEANPDWNTGWLLNYNEYSIGLIDDGGERAIVFNINLAQKIFEVKKDKREYFDDIKFKLINRLVITMTIPHKLHPAPARSDQTFH